jgi:hypothetical protein
MTKSFKIWTNTLGIFSTQVNHNRLELNKLKFRDYNSKEFIKLDHNKKFITVETVTMIFMVFTIAIKLQIILTH